MSSKNTVSIDVRCLTDLLKSLDTRIDALASNKDYFSHSMAADRLVVTLDTLLSLNLLSSASYTSYIDRIRLTAGSAAD